ncbi:MAG: 16S rRNA processing protein RimM [Deltaproteobacteria bacterium]|nr:16S rRNA processing protein RimM [Deltaproteobacteria bacterium]MBW2052711.1 16S rRNA processing protein RimM [Deltaproteobacteria bacterium]MBW2141205.1 16S rRNA processing protein RimM [Deltaproteobacteria bacterium]MBW2323067.1 16S rRNA processing protein RimM [Deltaproteobacteria bacterium]
MTDDLVTIGRVTRTHGVRGEMRVLPFTESVNAFECYDRLYFRVPDEAEMLIRITSVRPHKNFVLLKLEGVFTLEAAKELVGAEVLIPRSWLPSLDSDEYYWTDLIGLIVTDEEGRKLGRVKNLLSTGADDLLVLEWENKEILLPFREEIVLSIDLEAGSITAAPSPGLLDQ